MDIIPPEQPRKQCTKCGIKFPLTSDFFPREAKRKDGFKNQCKICTNAYAKAHRSLPEVQERVKAYYARPDIKERERTRYSADEDHKRYLAYYSRPEKRQHILDKRKSDYNDPEKRESILAARRTPEHREQERNYKKRPKVQKRIRTYKSSPKVREKNRAYYSRPDVQERHRMYYHIPEQREQKRARYHHRRALKKSSTGAYTPVQLQEQYMRQRKKCYYCQKKVKWGAHHIEHVIPVSRGGTNDISNIVIACPPCNMHKHNKLPHEWPEGGRLL